VLLVANSRFNDELVESIWDEGDGNINLGDLLVKSLAVVDIEGNGVAVGQAFRELPGTVDSTASDGDGDASLTEDTCSRPEIVLAMKLPIRLLAPT